MARRYPARDGLQVCYEFVPGDRVVSRTSSKHIIDEIFAYVGHEGLHSFQVYTTDDHVLNDQEVQYFEPITSQ